RRRNHCRANHSRRKLLRHSTVNHTRNFHVDHGRRGGKTFHWNPLDSGGTNCVGVDFHSSSNRLDRLHARTRNWNALSSDKPAPARAALNRDKQPNDYPFSSDTEVALIIAKTFSPSFRFNRSTELVVITDVTIPAAVRITTSDITLSEVIFSI